ncbi:MAG: hypothetical protein HYT06_00880 [Candidatus Levybacteria bacterium]|nr:hypothetical protein [Candidatus Levybacteria bacterium]
MKIIVLGNGKWGGAMASLLRENNKEFSFWQRDTNIEDNSILVNCLPTQVIREVFETYGKNLKNIIVVNGAKGIEQNTHRLQYEIFKDIYGENLDYFTLIGPGFAQEIIDKMPTLVNIGYFKAQNCEIVKDLFQTDYFRIRLVDHVRALELSAAFKNIYAIATGIADGLGFQTNTKTKLIIIAIEELYRLSKSLNLVIDEDMIAGTVGDLILTCSSEESRNFSFGKLLAKEKVKEALSIVGETTEGYHAIESLPYFEQKAKVKLSLARFVYEAVKQDEPEKIRELFITFVENV